MPIASHFIPVLHVRKLIFVAGLVLKGKTVQTSECSNKITHFHIQVITELHHSEVQLCPIWQGSFQEGEREYGEIAPYSHSKCSHLIISLLISPNLYQLQNHSRPYYILKESLLNSALSFHTRLNSFIVKSRTLKSAQLAHHSGTSAKRLKVLPNNIINQNSLYYILYDLCTCVDNPGSTKVTNI